VTEADIDDKQEDPSGLKEHMMSNPQIDHAQLISWLSIDATTGREGPFLSRVEEDFQREGMVTFRQRIEDGRWNLWATSPHHPSPEILFSTHVDTVPPFFGPTADDTRVSARGACDTKGGLYAMLRAWRALTEIERRHVGFLAVVGEEVDHIGAIVAADDPRFHPRHIVLCEPTQGRQARAQKGIIKFVVHASGREGHSAYAEAGVSAIDRLLDALGDLRAHAWPVDPVLGPTTFNIGLIRGGVAANIFAPDASAVILMRATDDTDVLWSQIVRALGARDHVRLERLCANEPVKLATIGNEETCVVPFNTDAPYLQRLAPVTLVGPGDIRCAHGPEEHIRWDDLEGGIERYTQLARELLAAARVL